MRRLMWLLVALLSTMGPGEAEAKVYGKWLLVKKKKGLKIYQMHIKGSPHIAMRGDVVLNAPTARLIYMLENISHRKKWVARLKKMVVLQRLSKYARIVYSHFALPWPIAHRDFVYKLEMIIDHKNKRIIRKARSVTHPKAPKTVGVRAVLKRSYYIIKPVDGGKRTFMRAEFHGDPKGWLPAWLVNGLAKNWPSKTVKNMTKSVKMSFVREHPEIKKILACWYAKTAQDKASLCPKKKSPPRPRPRPR